MEYVLLKESNIDRVIPMYLEYYNGYEDKEWTRENAYNRIRQVVTRQDAYGLILQNGGAVLGFVMGYFEQYDDGIVYDLVEIVVAAGQQGKGLGTKMMREIETRAREKGAILIQLQAVNDAMHDTFYGKLGYRNASNLVIKSKVL